MAGARNVDYTDQEFLHIMDDLADDKGWSDSKEIADRLGIKARKNGNGKTTHPAQNIGVRLAWMKRYGFVLNDERQRGLWRITARGRRFMDAKLTAPQKAMLENMRKEDSLDVLNVLGRRLFLTGNDEMARTAFRREFQYYTFTGQRVRSRRR